MSMLDVHQQPNNRYTASTIRGGEPVSPLMPAFPSDSECSKDIASGSVAASKRRCYCGNPIRTRTGMYYCSPDCARGDAFSSLTHARSASSISNLADAFDDRLPNRATSTASSGDFDDGSHYRRLKRDERREVERRQRAEACSQSPESTRSPSAVPELVSSHSRNTSTASSTFSFASSSGGLSRHPSTASHTPFTASVVIDDAIMEDEDELSEVPSSTRSTLRGAQARRRLAEEAKGLGPGSMLGKNMAVDDMLDEIINMEESFRVPDDPIERRGRHRRGTSTPDDNFVPTAFRPPRTPSPPLRRRASIIPPAPNAPDRRNSLSQHRPPSMYAHASSLSESHTALYLATASPVAPAYKPRHRRSASPKLSVRRSITFTPEAAGPSLARPPRSRIDSPGLTPVRRKHLTPTAHHPPMEGWRFPTASSNATPTNARYNTAPLNEVPDAAPNVRPQLLWPAPRSDSLPAAQQLERSSSYTGGNYSSPSLAPRYSPDDELFQPPSSALRLGMLMNSDDADMDSDDASTVRGSIRGSVRSSFTAPIPPFTQRGW